MEKGVKILSGRDGKNIVNTDNAKRAQKALSHKKSGWKWHFYTNLSYEGGKNILIIYLRGVNIFYLALRGGIKIFVTSF